MYGDDISCVISKDTLKSHLEYITHTLKNVNFYTALNFEDLLDLICIFETLIRTFHHLKG